MSMFSTPHGVGRPNHNAHNTRIVTMMLTHPHPLLSELESLTCRPFVLFDLMLPPAQFFGPRSLPSAPLSVSAVQCGHVL